MSTSLLDLVTVLIGSPVSHLKLAQSTRLEYVNSDVNLDLYQASLDMSTLMLASLPNVNFYVNLTLCQLSCSVEYVNLHVELGSLSTALFGWSCQLSRMNLTSLSTAQLNSVDYPAWLVISTLELTLPCLVGHVNS